MQLVISDAHEGLKVAIAAVLVGASWQRCRTHFVRNLLTRVPKSAQAMVATLVRSIFEQPDAASTWAQHARVVEQLDDKFADAATMLTDAAGEVLAFTPDFFGMGSKQSYVAECLRKLSNPPEEFERLISLKDKRGWDS